ncbi:MAG TPA: hypothetical protein PLZ42_05675, partial [Methanothrix sp.]|nr:hypothetical protein [Methanothrix sp.]
MYDPASIYNFIEFGHYKDLKPSVIRMIFDAPHLFLGRCPLDFVGVLRRTFFGGRGGAAGGGMHNLYIQRRYLDIIVQN